MVAVEKIYVLVHVQPSLQRKHNTLRMCFCSAHREKVNPVKLTAFNTVFAQNMCMYVCHWHVYNVLRVYYPLYIHSI